MNPTHDLLHRSITSPRREDRRSRETSTYSSPVSNSSQGGVSPIGLGISRCEIENAFDQLRVFPPPSTLPSQLVPGAPTPTFALSYDGYSSGTCYPPVYNGLVNSASETSLEFYSPTMSASPSYNSTMEVVPGQHVYPSQMTDLWMHTPCSGPTTPSDVTPGTVANGAGQWDHIVFSDACIPPTIPLLPVNNVPYLGVMGEMGEMGYDGSSGQSINTGPIMPQQASPEGTDEATISGRERGSSNDRLISASGLECPICGAKFTRRSNCKEHQKMHNPEWKNNHPCNDCHKSFGRSSDLKRHMSTVHLGLRRYSCDRCDRSFSRQDSLARQAPQRWEVSPYAQSPSTIVKPPLS
ncbi:hypothetical protein N7447_010203 [Penicillium robsamsonii]|uniref:uncharacterized protein n=1 Tax=Penicillium robsamsonii TaxID=1792511 RepID=UPI002548AF1D|nr:uncharacterized protein N7447_010203 [Penicillium robsamsonii]KAJ5813180.1 hypothetical protein N7447_010203 [Penicillium robsamsonii]